MISNYEFIKTQTFELSWAVFRCTELFTQDKLRKEVEAAAVELTVDPGTLLEVAENESPRIEKLTSLIRLAESVGQIASVNASVLYRELDNLSKAIRFEISERRDKKNISVSLDSMFTNSAYTNNLQLTTDNGLPNANSASIASTILSASLAVPAESGIQSVQKQGVDNSAIRQTQDKASQFGSIEQLLSVATRPSITADGGSNSAISANANPLNQFMQSAVQEVVQPTQSARQSEFIAQSPAVPAQSRPVATTAPVITPTRQAQVATTGSWQNVILQKVKDLGQTTTKELTANFPEISERTIRFYLQKLVDNQAIDRIGSTGPGAAYRAKI